jgi:hypothetical protein
MLYRKKSEAHSAWRFVSNNEAQPVHMDAIVNELNQGQTRCKAWHNGTNIYLVNSPGVADTSVHVGDWIVRDPADKFLVMSNDVFTQHFEPVP